MASETTVWLTQLKARRTQSGQRAVIERKEVEQAAKLASLLRLSRDSFQSRLGYKAGAHQVSVAREGYG